MLEPMRSIWFWALVGPVAADWGAVVAVGLSGVGAGVGPELAAEAGVGVRGAAGGVGVAGAAGEGVGVAAEPHAESAAPPPRSSASAAPRLRNARRVIRGRRVESTMRSDYLSLWRRRVLRASLVTGATLGCGPPIPWRPPLRRRSSNLPLKPSSMDGWAYDRSGCLVVSRARREGEAASGHDQLLARLEPARVEKELDVGSGEAGPGARITVGVRGDLLERVAGLDDVGAPSRWR